MNFKRFESYFIIMILVSSIKSTDFSCIGIAALVVTIDSFIHIINHLSGNGQPATSRVIYMPCGLFFLKKKTQKGDNMYDDNKNMHGSSQ